MADQVDPNYQAPVYPESPSPEESTVPPIQTNPVSPPEIPVYEPASPPPSEESPTVVVASQNGVPKWFYFLFVLTLIIFFIITALLVVNFTQKKSILQLLGLGVRQETPTPIPTVPSAPSPVATGEFLPSISPTSPVISAVNLKLPELTATDEVPDLAKDVNSTDFTKLDKAITNLDQEMGEIGVTP